MKFLRRLWRTRAWVPLNVYFCAGYLNAIAWNHMSYVWAFPTTIFTLILVSYFHMITSKVKHSDETYREYRAMTKEQEAWMRSRLKEVWASVEAWEKEHGDGEEWKRQ